MDAEMVDVPLFRTGEAHIGKKFRLATPTVDFPSIVKYTAFSEAIYTRCQSAKDHYKNLGAAQPFLLFGRRLNLVGVINKFRYDWWGRKKVVTRIPRRGVLLPMATKPIFHGHGKKPCDWLVVGNIKFHYGVVRCRLGKTETGNMYYRNFHVNGASCIINTCTVAKFRDAVTELYERRIAHEALSKEMRHPITPYRRRWYSYPMPKKGALMYIAFLLLI